MFLIYIYYLGRFYSAELLARLIIIYYCYERVEPSLKQFIEGFFFLYAVDFKNYMQEHFLVKNPFVDSYKLFQEILYQENNFETNIFDKIFNFFNSMVGSDYPDLAIKASEM